MRWLFGSAAVLVGLAVGLVVGLVIASGAVHEGMQHLSPHNASWFPAVDWLADMLTIGFGAVCLCIGSVFAGGAIGLVLGLVAGLVPKEQSVYVYAGAGALAVVALISAFALKQKMALDEANAPGTVKQAIAYPQQPVPAPVKPPAPAPTAPATPETSPDIPADLPQLSSEEMQQGASELPKLLGAYLSNAGFCELLVLGQRKPREGGSVWPSAIFAYPKDRPSSDILPAYISQFPGGQVGQESYRIEAQRPGDGAKLVVFLYRAKVGPAAGSMTIQFMTP